MALGLGVLMDVLLGEAAEEDAVEAGVQPVQVHATHVAHARLGLKCREGTLVSHEPHEPGLQLTPTGALDLGCAAGRIQTPEWGLATYNGTQVAPTLAGLGGGVVRGSPRQFWKDLAAVTGRINSSPLMKNHRVLTDVCMHTPPQTCTHTPPTRVHAHTPPYVYTQVHTPSSACHGRISANKQSRNNKYT